MALTSSAFWFALGSIILTNVVLSGDNAVVIALAARSLPAKQQKLAILWGAGAAVILRIILTFFAVALLALPWLKIVGSRHRRRPDQRSEAHRRHEDVQRRSGNGRRGHDR